MSWHCKQKLLTSQPEEQQGKCCSKLSAGPQQLQHTLCDSGSVPACQPLMDVKLNQRLPMGQLFIARHVGSSSSTVSWACPAVTTSSTTCMLSPRGGFPADSCGLRSLNFSQPASA